MRTSSTAGKYTLQQATDIGALPQEQAYLLPGDVGHHPRVSLEVAAHVHREDQIHATLLGKGLVQLVLILVIDECAIRTRDEENRKDA